MLASIINNNNNKHYDMIHQSNDSKQIMILPLYSSFPVLNSLKNSSISSLLLLLLYHYFINRINHIKIAFMVISLIEAFFILNTILLYHHRCSLGINI